jgi:hypothetical protein
MMRLRAVFRSLAAGRGTAGALAEAFARAQGEESDVARQVLLGNPPAVALRSLLDGCSGEVSTLASLIVNSTGASARLVGAKGEGMSVTMERWLKRSEARRMEHKVMQSRGLMMSAVLGAVVAILASLGPLVADAGFLSPGTGPGSGTLLCASAAMVATSSLMLGLFTSKRKFYANVAIALAAFVLAALAIAPLANVPAIQPLAIK